MSTSLSRLATSRGALTASLRRAGTIYERERGATPPTVLEFADLTLQVEKGEVHRGDRLIHCTAREFALLKHFLRHPRQVLTRDQLLSAIWADEETDDNVVAVYVGYLRAKLDGAGEPRLIQTVRGFGYSLREA